MSESTRAFARRAARYVLAAAGLGVVVGFFLEGVGGALALGFAVGLGVAVGLLGAELLQRGG